MSFLVLDDDEYSFIWETLCELQLIFHPSYSREGNIDYKELLHVKNSKRIIVMLDRNLLSGLLKLSRDGYLNDEQEMRIIALLMTWMIMNNFPASAGLALKEYATKINDIIEPKRELREFNNIFDYYPSMMWLRLAEAAIDRIPVCPLPTEPFITEIEYNEDDDHLLMHIAEMLYVVYLCRRPELSPVEKMLDFLIWNYKYLLICESTLVYTAMLFTNQSGIKAPKNSGSNDIEKILTGCRNQAWDLNYLSNWSSFHYYEKTMDEIFMFATNDILLKRIFINTYADGGVGALIEAVFSKSDSQKIFDAINFNQGNRIKPDFGVNPKIYLRQLIEQEKHRVMEIISDRGHFSYQ
ncbi:hypothetical protein DFQ01_1036 [Paenibacillus cellulosilyticus]|uniref:Uncharacterized protein n=1 Tax=Paenibacillus cellulosilyticus TaxID=375489 RepID=A0A2V2YWJ1_9BACL|nr:hypothetical protein [Paenibacillus cellulosilyticus]PWW06107.1 hypothetical protein DFQ01_1036 [Paenibacillus cellulosilyticus]